MKIPVIGELMTPGPVSIAGSKTVRQAKLLMSSKSIRHLPVIEEGRLEGILSDRDIKMAQAVSKNPGFDDKCLVREICTPDPYVVSHDTPADEVLQEMQKKKLGSVLVTRDERLVGIFTMTDACRAFAKFLRAAEETQSQP